MPDDVNVSDVNARHKNGYLWKIMLLIQKHCNSGEFWFKFKYYTKDFKNPQDMPA